MVLCAIDPPDMALPLDIESPCARAWPAMSMDAAALIIRIRDMKSSGKCACRRCEGRIRVGTEGTQALVHARYEAAHRFVTREPVNFDYFSTSASATTIPSEGWPGFSPNNVMTVG